MKVCKVNGCDGKHHGLGYCQRHYQQIKKYGRIIRTRFDKNEIVIYEDYAEILLCDKDGEEVGRALIDLEDIDKVKDYKWCLCNGYVYNIKIGFLHRFLMNCPNDMIVDHKNHNPLDNRKDNLRICTAQNNSMNISKRNNCTSQHKGIDWKKEKNKWRARIKINGKSKHIGYYDSEEEASIEYDKAAILYYGLYASLNHPIENYIDYVLDLGLNPNDFGDKKRS